MDEKQKKILILNQEIINLKDELSAGDYKAIKTWEAQQLGEEAPYDTKTLIEERKKIRDAINEKQAELDQLEAE